jgi:hypothetical protein
LRIEKPLRNGEPRWRKNACRGLARIRNPGREGSPCTDWHGIRISIAPFCCQKTCTASWRSLGTQRSRFQFHSAMADFQEVLAGCCRNDCDDLSRHLCRIVQASQKQASYNMTKGRQVSPVPEKILVDRAKKASYRMTRIEGVANRKSVLADCRVLNSD